MLITLISKNICERLLLIVVYILLKKLNEIVQEPDCLLLHFEIQNYSIVLTLIRIQLFYHSLSFAVTQCHFLLLVAIRCQSLYHSLSIVLPLVVIRCHSFSLAVPLVVTCCTTRVSFYKRSFSSIDLFA